MKINHATPLKAWGYLLVSEQKWTMLLKSINEALRSGKPFNRPLCLLDNGENTLTQKHNSFWIFFLTEIVIVSDYKLSKHQRHDLWKTAQISHIFIIKQKHNKLLKSTLV